MGVDASRREAARPPEYRDAAPCSARTFCEIASHEGFSAKKRRAWHYYKCAGEGLSVDVKHMILYLPMLTSSGLKLEPGTPSWSRENGRS